MDKPDLGKLNQWLSFGQEVAKRRHWEYFVIDQYLRGNHNVKGNPQDNTIEVIRKPESISYPINKLYSTFRAVRAFVTRHQPVVEVEPVNSSEEAKKAARRDNKVLERDNKLNNFRRINKEWVYYGIKYGVGWRQVGYDPEKKLCIRWTVDPNDLVLGSVDGQYQDTPYMIKTVKRTVAYLKDKYPKAAASLSPDGKIASNEYATLAWQVNNITATGQKQTPDEDTVMVHECWYRILEKNAKGGLINKTTFTETAILDEEETPYTEYPFIPYYAEVTPNEIGSDGHLKHVIPAQRMLNLLNTQLLEYNHLVNRGRFLKDKNAGFRVINTKEGQIIEKNPTKMVQVLNPPAVNPMLERQLSLAIDFIEDLGGQHDASLGSIPQRVNSGAAIEALQTGDSNNISDLRDNFEDALAAEAAWILKMYSLFESEGIVLAEQEGKEEKPFMAYGKIAREKSGQTVPSRYYDNGAYIDTYAILDDHQVKVSVVSALGETRAARMELLFKLIDLGVISGRSVLQHIEFPGVDDMLEQLASEELAQVALTQLKGQGPGGPPLPGQPPMPPTPPPAQGPLPTPPPEAATP